jgi:hypothetical protein
MTKGRHKRKKQHVKKKAEQATAQTSIVEDEKMTDREAEAVMQATAKSTKNKNPSRWQRFKEYVRSSSSFTDWCIAAFTFVLAAASIYQFIIMGGQLDTMRKDQRPWIRVVFSAAPMQALAPIGGTVQLVNNGKTPARGKIRGDFVVAKIKNGEQPGFDYPQPHVIAKMGMISPGDTPQNVTIERKQLAANGTDIESYPLTAPEFEDVKQLKIFFIVYGTVHYADFFGTDHWTRFCQYMVPANVSGSVTAEPCAEYSDVDSK